MKTRFCPSPTGEIHIGNARTALFCDLLAKHMHDGCLLLRIEDTDQERSEMHYVEQLYQDLQWLGIKWHEGPIVGGQLGPYFQSERQTIYNQYYEKLIEKGVLYPCFCTPEQLEIQRKIQRSRGIAPRYAGTCRNLSDKVIEEKKSQGLRPTLRFRVAEKQWIEFEDLVKGPQKFNTDDIGDFIVQRADGTAPFLFCNAIDDALMHVTHVLRGEDHLTNTPRQLMILQALDLPIPKYGHTTLIMALDGSPLSKRNGSQSIKNLRQQGFLPEAIINYLARLGHHYANPAYMTHQQLGYNFSIEHLGRAAARYDHDQLLFWQKEAIMHAETSYLWHWMEQNINTQQIPTELQYPFIEAIRGNVLFPKDAIEWINILFNETLDYLPEHQALLLQTPKEYFQIAKDMILNNHIDVQTIFSAIKEKLQLKGKELFQPLRIAITNQLHGPELAKLIPLLGSEKLLKRIDKILET